MRSDTQGAQLYAGPQRAQYVRRVGTKRASCIELSAVERVRSRTDSAVHGATRRVPMHTRYLIPSR